MCDLSALLHLSTMKYCITLTQWDTLTFWVFSILFWYFIKMEQRPQPSDLVLCWVENVFWIIALPLDDGPPIFYCDIFLHSVFIYPRLYPAATITSHIINNDEWAPFLRATMDMLFSPVYSKHKVPKGCEGWGVGYMIRWNWFINHHTIHNNICIYTLVHLT